MKVKSVSYKKLVNAGNFQHQSLEVCVELEDGDTPGAALIRAKAFVEAGLKPQATEAMFKSAKEILANPDAHTGYQVREAQKIKDLTAQGTEIPF